MRILIIHNYYRSEQPSGENRAVERQVALLLDAGHDVVVYARHSDDIENFSARRRAAVPLGVVWSSSARRDVERLLDSYQPDVIHVHNTFPLLSPSILAPCAAKAPVVVTLHNYRLICPQGQLFRDGRPCEDCVGRIPWPGAVHGCYRDSRAATVPLAAALQLHRMLGVWNRHSSAFIVLSRFSRSKLIAGGIAGEKMHVVPNFSPRPARRRTGPGDHFLFLGRLSVEKGPQIVARAWQPDFGKLLLIGDGPLLEAIRADVADKSESVEVLGLQPFERAMELLSNARALIVASQVYEACPLVLTEAYAHGVPVIAPSLGAFSEMVQENGTGRLFTPGDSESLTACIHDLTDDPRSLRLGEAAWERYEREFSPERHLASLIEIYERVRLPRTAATRGALNTD